MWLTTWMFGTGPQAPILNPGGAVSDQETQSAISAIVCYAKTRAMNLNSLPVFKANVGQAWAQFARKNINERPWVILTAQNRYDDLVSLLSIVEDGFELSEDEIKNFFFHAAAQSLLEKEQIAGWTKVIHALFTNPHAPTRQRALTALMANDGGVPVRTPFQYAISSNRRQIAQVMRQHGAKATPLEVLYTWNIINKDSVEKLRGVEKIFGIFSGIFGVVSMVAFLKALGNRIVRTGNAYKKPVLWTLIGAEALTGGVGKGVVTASVKAIGLTILSLGFSLKKIFPILQSTGLWGLTQLIGVTAAYYLNPLSFCSQKVRWIFRRLDAMGGQYLAMAVVVLASGYYNNLSSDSQAANASSTDQPAVMETAFRLSGVARTLWDNVSWWGPSAAVAAYRWIRS